MKRFQCITNEAMQNPYVTVRKKEKDFIKKEHIFNPVKRLEYELGKKPLPDHICYRYYFKVSSRLI